MNVQYVTDATGHPVSVIVPIDLWRKLTKTNPFDSAKIAQPNQADIWQWSGIFKDDEQFDQAIRELQQAWQQWTTNLSA